MQSKQKMPSSDECRLDLRSSLLGRRRGFAPIERMIDSTRSSLRAPRPWARSSEAYHSIRYRYFRGAPQQPDPARKDRSPARLDNAWIEILTSCEDTRR